MPDTELDPNSLTEEQLESVLWGGRDLDEVVPSTPDAPAPEPEKAPDEVITDPMGTPVPEPEKITPPAEPEPDMAELERQAQALRDRRRDEELDLLKAHNSRLAGKVGFLEQELKKGRPAPEPEYRPEAEDEPQVARLTRDFQTLREEREAEKRAAVLQEEITASRARYAAANYTDEEIATAAGKYAATWQEVLEANDPQTTREMARNVFARVSTEIEERRLESKIAKAKELKAASDAKRTEAKKTAAISGSGAAPVAPTKPKTPDDMTAEELSKEIWGR